MSEITITALHLSGFEVSVQGLSFDEIESTIALLGAPGVIGGLCNTFHNPAYVTSMIM